MSFAELVPDVMSLEMGGAVAPRVDFTHPAAACEQMTGGTEGWTAIRRRWAIRYTAGGEDECYGEGKCFNGEPCGCFQVATWAQVRRIAPEHRQPIWWLP